MPSDWIWSFEAQILSGCDNYREPAWRGTVLVPGFGDTDDNEPAARKVAFAAVENRIENDPRIDPLISIELGECVSNDDDLTSVCFADENG